VVDAEDLGLVEDLVHLLVERHRALQVGAERLLHHHPGPLDQLGVVQHADHVERGLGRHAQVVQPAHALAELFLRRRHGRGQRLRPGRAGHVAQGGGEGVPLLPGEPVLAVLDHRRLGERAELVVGHLLQRGGDDDHLGGQRRGVQMGQPGQELPPGQIAGRAEQDDDVRG
jgi:hypothetical protein